MTFPTIFANLPAGNQPASLLDTMYNIVGAQGIIPTTATGTNTYSLTSNTNYYAPASYQNFQTVGWVVPNSSTGAVTARLNGLAFINVYMPSGLQAQSGDLTAGAFIIMCFNAALNSGAGGFQVFNSTTPSVIQPVAGTFKNLQVGNSAGTPDTIITVTADEVMLENVPGGTAKVSSVSLNINTTTNGANGLDSGSMAANTFYSVWVILNTGTSAVAGLISLSTTSPTLPSGFTYRARVGWMRTGAASTNLHRVLQLGRQARYVVTPASQTTSLPNIVSGNTGNPGVPTWTSFTVRAASGATAFVPPTASQITVQPSGFSTSTSLTTIIIAPNSNYAAFNSTTPPPIVFEPGLSAGNAYLFPIMLESNAISVASLAGLSALVNLYGWEDNL